MQLVSFTTCGQIEDLVSKTQLLNTEMEHNENYEYKKIKIKISI
jgi:hypothetical protein